MHTFRSAVLEKHELHLDLFAFVGALLLLYVASIVVVVVSMSFDNDISRFSILYVRFHFNDMTTVGWFLGTSKCGARVCMWRYMTVSAVCCAYTRRENYFLINRLFRFARLMALADYHRQQPAAVSNRISQTFNGSTSNQNGSILDSPTCRWIAICIYIPLIECYTHLSYIYFIWWWKSHIIAIA